MANALGVTASAVNKWEKGNTVPADLPLAVYQKDKEKTLRVLEAIEENLSRLTDFKKSRLYRHMDLRRAKSDQI